MKKSYLALAGITGLTGAFYLFGAAGCTTTGGTKATATPKPTNTPAPTATPTNTPTNTPVPGAGYVLVLGGDDGSAYKNTSYVGQITGPGAITWTTGPAVPVMANWTGAAAAATGGYIYTATGDSGSSALTATYAGTVGGGGSVAWATSGTMPGGASYPAYAQSATNLYIAGGYSSFSFSTIVSTTYAGTFGGGSTSGWTAGPALPTTLVAGGLAQANGYLFYLGGFDGSALASTIYSATASGTTIGSWSTNSSVLPATLAGQEAIAAGNQIYVFGGYDGATVVSTVYTSAVGSGGTLGSWTTTNSMPGANENYAYVAVPTAFNGYIYFIGGYTGSAVLSSVYQATFSGGTLGSWSASTAFPVMINDIATAY